MIIKPQPLIPQSFINTILTIIIILFPLILLSLLISIFYYDFSDPFSLGILTYVGAVFIVQLVLLIFSKDIVMRMLGARRIFDGRIYEAVKEISQKANIPTPEVYIIPNPTPNAFAIGILKSRSAIGINSGLIEVLKDNELRGVIAHEVAHIKNRDTLLLTTASVLFNIVGIAIEILGRNLLFRSNERERAIGVILVVLSLLFRILLAPIFILALSRAREYIADETGARIIGDPLSLADALTRIEEYYNKMLYKAMRYNYSDEPVRMMYIHSPKKSSFLEEIFSTHPPVYKRVERLRELAREMGIY